MAKLILSQPDFSLSNYVGVLANMVVAGDNQSLNKTGDGKNQFRTNTFNDGVDISGNKHTLTFNCQSGNTNPWIIWYRMDGGSAFTVEQYYISSYAS